MAARAKIKAMELIRNNFCSALSKFSSSTDFSSENKNSEKTIFKFRLLSSLKQ